MGMPKSQVSRFHKMPPMRPGEDDGQAHGGIDAGQQVAGLGVLHLEDFVVTVTATSTGKEGADEVQDTCEQNCGLRLGAPVAIDVAMALRCRGTRW